jgi:nucleotide-binding universal stress UspA family protein
MKKILVATDGSPSSAEAVAFGVDMARELDAKLTFVHVAPALDVAPMLGFPMVGAIPHHMSPADAAPLESALVYAGAHGVPAESELLVGDTVDEIVAFADSHDVDLIVVGSHGHGSIASALLGSVSRGVLHEARRPVTVVRGDVAEIEPEEPLELAERSTR